MHGRNMKPVPPVPGVVSCRPSCWGSCTSCSDSCWSCMACTRRLERHHPWCSRHRTLLCHQMLRATSRIHPTWVPSPSSYLPDVLLWQEGTWLVEQNWIRCQTQGHGWTKGLLVLASARSVMHGALRAMRKNTICCAHPQDTSSTAVSSAPQKYSNRGEVDDQQPCDKGVLCQWSWATTKQPRVFDPELMDRSSHQVDCDLGRVHLLRAGWWSCSLSTWRPLRSRHTWQMASFTPWPADADRSSSVEVHVERRESLQTETPRRGRP